MVFIAIDALGGDIFVRGLPCPQQGLAEKKGPKRGGGAGREKITAGRRETGDGRGGKDAGEGSQKN